MSSVLSFYLLASIRAVVATNNEAYVKKDFFVSQALMYKTVFRKYLRK